MGYRIGTKVKCSNPELLHSGSTFNNEWKDFLFDVKDGVTEYFCRNDYLNEAIIELSLQHPDVTFTGVTWIDDDYYDSIDYTYIVKNGDFKIAKKEPHYNFMYQPLENDEYKPLLKKFIKQIFQYLERIDVIHEDPNDSTVFDFLNDKADKDGFQSYFTITWENDIHKFTATKRFTSLIIIDYQRKTKRDINESDLDCIQDYDIQDAGVILRREDWALEEHLILCATEDNDFYVEYDEHLTNLINESYYDSIDFDDFDCLTEDDLFQDTWLVAGKEFPNYIDYFWDAEITDLFHNENGDFYIKYREGLSECIYNHYQKYRCLVDDSGFVFCKKESCEGCNQVNKKKVINPHYRLWEKFVKP
jgi:hypothetical protein